MFNDFDKEGKVDAELQNPKFIMRVKDVKETFDAFYIRFIIIIAPLDIFKREKIDYLKRLIANRLKYRILDYSSSTSYRELIIRLRQIDLNIRFVDEQSPKDTRGVKTKKTKKTKETESFNTKTRRDKNNEKRENYFNGIITNRDKRYQHLQHIANKLKKKNKCFKCL